MNDDNSGTHRGKAMIQANEHEVTLTTDCTKCGRVVIGPIPTLHLRAVAHIINHIATQLGLPEGGFDDEFSDPIHASTPAEFERAQQAYEEMSTEKPEFTHPQKGGSLWGD